MTMCGAKRQGDPIRKMLAMIENRVKKYEAGERPSSIFDEIELIEEQLLNLLEQLEEREDESPDETRDRIIDLVSE